MHINPFSGNARRLRQARAAIRRAERAVAKRRRVATPGYDELSSPLFLGLMALALIVLVFDVGTGADQSVLAGWLRIAAAAVGSCW